MPDRPLREISRAVATSRSPSLPGISKEMSHCAATARKLWLLQAKAKAESASAKMKPPWAMRWPLTMCGWTVIRSEGDVALRRDRAQVMAVAGKGKGGIRQREDEAAMGDALAVDHVRLDRHQI